jgi:3-hydroxymyristoyl/3-hydroxydecanoyl-(acyl carrier protein) dehydratase
MSSSQNILSLIPQAPPFVMIDELLVSSELSAKTGLTIREDNLFVHDNCFQEPGLLENIAQTAAARVGYDAKANGTPVPVGYIGAINDVKIFDLPKVGDRIETEIIIENQIFNVTIISGKIMCNESVMATCKMKIFLSNT